jgi:hypothetical protein
MTDPATNINKSNALAPQSAQLPPMPIQRIVARKFGKAILLDALAHHVDEGQRAVILFDGVGGVEDVVADARVARMIDVRHEPISVLDGIDEACVVIYACSQDDLGLPFIARLHQSGRRYFPIWSAAPGGYAFTNAVARRVLEEEWTHQHARGFAKWDFGFRDFENLIQAVEVTRGLAGCYLEVGCYQGSSAGVVLRYLAATQRHIRAHFLDVFDGFNYSASADSADAIWHGTHQTDGIDAVRERLLEYGLAWSGLQIGVDRCNIVTDPLPRDVVDHGIAVANLDVDLHEAVDAGLRKIAPHIVRDGILIVEDPGHTPLLIGARLALQGFLHEPIGKQFMPIAMQSGQTFLIRR